MVMKDPKKKEYFLRFICEISAVQAWSDNISVQLCWECEALLQRLNKFKNKAQHSLVTLKNFTEKRPEVKTSLQINKQFSINLCPNENLTATTYSEIVKLEENEVPIVKEEFDKFSVYDGHNSDNYSDDDDKTLEELSQMINNQMNNYKKKRRKIEEHIEKSEIKKEEQCYVEKELTNQEIEEERRSLQLKEDYVNAVFRCDRCILAFPNAEDLKDHINIKHELNGAQWKCPWCECTLGSQVAFNYHTTKHTKRYVCCVCGHAARSKRAAQRHYDTTHCARPDLEYNELLENGASKDQTLETDGTESIKNDTPAFQCEFCDKSFRWKTSLRKHLETHRIETGQKRRPYCETCRLSFTTTSNLQKHVKTSSKHQIQLKLRKLKDDSTLPDKDKEQSKIEQIRCSVNSKRQVFPCAQCDRRFQWRGNLLRHLHSHRAKANGELVCEPCNRTFSSIATYNQHMKISRKHVSENDFKYMCSDCGKKFANKTRLKDHVDWEHLKNFVHKCPVCQKVFKSHTSLYLHKQVVHKKNNPDHLCDHCGKPFPNRAKLRNHIIALHTTEAPYACSTCNARFSWHSCLSRHVRRVHKAKPATGLLIGAEIVG
ncbi:hypothetical protein O0L34_g10590 [Tuta absoluta]|nr:hypothetical protein O0L34_g10590 [Tuta absoluta]